jgi:spore germination protein YaaH
MKKQIIPILTILIVLSSTASASQMIKYGFWDYPTSPSSYNTNWNALTHIAYFYWGENDTGNLNSDGSLNFPGDIDHYNAIRDLVHKHKLKLIICIRCADDDTIDEVLANHPDDLANEILSTIQVYGADGVNFNFEWIRPTNSITHTSNIILMEGLISKVYKKIKSADPNYHISIDTDTGVIKVWLNKNLNQYVDNIIICGYDYSAPWNSNITGPNAPYDDPTRWDVKDSVNLMLNYYDNEKIILGIPFYGYDYTATSERPGSITKQYKYIDMKSAIVNSYKYGRLWDSNSHTPWYKYKAGTTWHQVWYDDSESIELKCNYAKSKNLGGIGFWSLGMENSSIWESLI